METTKRESSFLPEKKKVCIVGGGPAGIVALRRVLDSPSLTGTIFEQKNDIGGLWSYMEEKMFATSPKNTSVSKSRPEDPENVTTMYDDLSCNLPYILMELKDFKHPRDQYTFASQKELHKYLRDYATQFKLWANIELNTAVFNIRPENNDAKDGDQVKWVVETHNHVTDVHKQDVYDAVMICTGKNAYPFPQPIMIPGLEEFKGKFMHCKYFKNAEEFNGQDVVLIGLGPSSADLALIISKKARSVTVCHKFPYDFRLGLLPSNACEIKSVKCITANSIVTECDEVVHCDTIIFCTGYGLKFPFLSPDCGVEVLNDKYVPHLYNMTIFTKRPTLSILNMCYRSPEFIIFEIQARYFVSYLEGKISITYEDMEKQVKIEEREKENLGIPTSLWFQIGDFGTQAWKYFWKMAEDIGIQEEYKHGPLLELVYNTTISRVFGKLAIYKQDAFKIVDETTWQIILNASPEFPETKEEKITMTLNDDLTISVKNEKITEPNV